MRVALIELALRDRRDAAPARQQVHEFARIAGIGEPERTRLATALSELVRVVVSQGGAGAVELAVETGANLVAIVVRDPGGALRSGGSVPGPAARALQDARSLIPETTFADRTAEGVVVSLVARRPARLDPIALDDVESWRGSLQRSSGASVDDLLLQQNRELTRTLAALLDREAELERNVQRIGELNAELIETNEGLLLTQFELTQARRVAEAATAAKAMFLATMSHEIRTPMNAVLGAAELLTRAALDPGRAELIRTLRTGADHLLGIVNDILDFSRMESGRMEVVERPFSVRRCVRQAVALVSRQAADKGLRVSVEIGPTTPPTLIGDANRVRQILTNFLSNAVKFTERGSIDVRVGAQPRDDGRFEVTWTVRDSGIGIRPGHLERLFHPYSQAENSTGREFGGTGLGLVISRMLAELMGGGAGAASTEGYGSTFWFTVLVHASAEALPEPDRDERDVTPVPAAEAPLGLRVLVVDDEPANRIVALRMLELLGCEVATAADGCAAVELVAAGDFDVVLMDLYMAPMDGITAAGEIRLRLTSDRWPRIVATTAGLRPVDPSVYRNVGIDGHLAKPLTVASLRHALCSLDDPDPEAIASPGDGSSGEPDAVSIAELRNLVGAEAWAGFVEDLRASAGPKLDRMRAAADTLDHATLSTEAHTLAGITAMLGAKALADSLRSVEARCVAGDLARCAEDARDCAARYDRLLLGLTEYGATPA